MRTLARIGLGSALAALSVAITLLIDSRAQAIPAFARRYRTSCRTCHAWSFPYLNASGTRFRQNGYQLPDGAEDPARAASMIEPGTIDERTAIFSTPPLSVRARLLAEWIEDAEGDQRLDASVPYARLAGGGSLYEDVSLVFSADVAPSPALHFLTVGLHDVLPRGGMSVVAGQLLLTGLQRPGHRSITRLASPLAQVSVGDNPFQLEGMHVGVSVQGRPGWGALAYELAVASGAPGAANQTGFGAPGVLGRLSLTTGEHTVGAFGYGAVARLRVDRGGIEREWDDRFVVTGLDAELSVWRLLFYVAGVLGVHDDPVGQGEATRYVGVRAEALWAITQELSVIARYDAVESSDASLRHRLATLHAGYLLLTSLRISLEASADLVALAEHDHDAERRDETRFVAMLEGAL
ncbi:MAG: hypothetical protein IT379_39200 [Deltaproteobacteria bacterium]|nr:hypothetical protein [Deltaproteobacteria bacterium]